MSEEDRLTARYGTAFMVLLVMCIAAFATRLMPLSFGQYPFNNDSLVECGIAADITNNGHLLYSPGSPWEGTHSVDLPAMSILLAYVSLMIGESPIGIAQLVTAVFSVLTIGAVFLLGKRVTGSDRGGLIASTAALLSGTFVFTTGSSWKLSLGFALIALLYLSFVRRNVLQYRLLTFVVLITLPFVHHLAAAIVMITLAFMLIWSWIVSISQSKVAKRLWLDTLTILPPIMIASAYYSIALIDRQSVYSSEIKVALFICNFVLLSIIAYLVMSMRSHRRISFAPIVGEGLAAILLFDYLGFVFPYSASAPSAYIVLIVCTAVLVMIAWYGTEMIIEHRREFMAVQLSLIVAPMTIILFGMETGLPNLTHQIVYRTFDFLQFFIFIGLAFSIIYLERNGSRVFRYAIAAMIVCLVCSFPFGFYTQDLLAVRHDTQRYEIDALEWLSDSAEDPQIVSDERLAFMAQNTIWVEKRASLPHDLMRGYVLWPGFLFLAEDSWTSSGVNNFPDGLAVIDETRFETALSRTNVIYIGGPAEDRIHVFTCNDYVSYTS